MSPVRVFILVIAAIAAITLAFLMRNAFGGKTAAPAVVATAPAPAPSVTTVQILTARRDLPIGTRITSSDLGWTAWPSAALNPAFITDGAAPAAPPSGAAAVAQQAKQTATSMVGQGPMQALEGSIVREPIIAGEPIIKRKLVKGGESGYMAVVLSPGMRAMSVSITTDTAAGGFILPGDRVDVLQSHPMEGGKGYASEVVLQNVRVLAVDQNTEAGKDAKSQVGAVATLEIPQADAEVLAKAQAEGKSGGGLVLALRSYADIGAPAGSVGHSSGAGSTIHVYRAGQASEVTVSR